MRTLGTVAVVVGGFLIGCSGTKSGSQSSAVNGGDVSHTNLTVTENTHDTSIECPGGTTACFNVDSDKNITHIFVNLGWDGCTPEGFTVTVDGVTVDPKDFHAPDTGPCNPNGQAGEDFIPRILWFPLPGNQKHAEVCVHIKGAIPALVSVGAKSAEECIAASLEQSCSNCPSPPPPDMGAPPPDMTCVPPVCEPPFADCNGICEDGCETNLSNDAHNCGACGNVCPAEAPICVNGCCVAPFPVP
jgi:hypothetical protein